MRISDWSSDVCSSDLLRLDVVTGLGDDHAGLSTDLFGQTAQFLFTAAAQHHRCPRSSQTCPNQSTDPATRTKYQNVGHTQSPLSENSQNNTIVHARPTRG